MACELGQQSSFDDVVDPEGAVATGRGETFSRRIEGKSVNILAVRRSKARLLCVDVPNGEVAFPVARSKRASVGSVDDGAGRRRQTPMAQAELAQLAESSPFPMAQLGVHSSSSSAAPIEGVFVDFRGSDRSVRRTRHTLPPVSL